MKRIIGLACFFGGLLALLWLASPRQGLSPRSEDASVDSTEPVPILPAPPVAAGVQPARPATELAAPANGRPFASAPKAALRADRHPDGQSFHGVVRDRVGGRPVAGAQVSIQPVAAGESMRFLATDEKGFFRCEVPSAGRYEVRITATGYAPLKKERVHLEKSNFLTFELTPLARLEGRVIDEAGRPVPGAGISATRSGGDPYSRRVGYSTDSDENGSFSFENLPGAGKYQLRATHHRYGSVSRTVSAPAKGWVTIRMGAVAPESALVAVAGRVVEPDGKPISNASVSIFDPDNPGTSMGRTLSGRDGRFQSRPVRPGKIGINAYATGFVSTPGNSLTLQPEPGESVNVQLVLAPAISFVGTVRDEEGGLVVGARVGVSAPGAASYGAITDSNGYFEFRETVPAGVNDLIVWQPDYRTYHGQVSLPREEPYEVILEKGLLLSGFARRTTGAAIDDFQLEMLQAGNGRLKRRDSIRGQGGRFEIKGLEPASYIVRLVCGGERAQVPLTLDRSRQVILEFESNPPRLEILDLR